MYNNMRKIQDSKITIITVVKNGMPYIEDSINSFNAQTYNYKELVLYVQIQPMVQQNI